MPCIAEDTGTAEKPATDAPRPRKEDLLPQIAPLALAGWSCRQIAATFGLPKSTEREKVRRGERECREYVSVPLPQSEPAPLNALPEGEFRDIRDAENCVEATKCPTATAPLTTAAEPPQPASIDGTERAKAGQTGTKMERYGTNRDEGGTKAGRTRDRVADEKRGNDFDFGPHRAGPRGRHPLTLSAS